jgi:hypothetical protein
LGISVKIPYALNIANQERVLAGFPSEVRESIGGRTLSARTYVAVVFLKNAFYERLNAHKGPTGSFCKLNNSTFNEINLLGNTLGVELRSPSFGNTLRLNVP